MHTNFWGQVKRERVRDRVVRDTADNITEPVYDMTLFLSGSFVADDTSEQVKDRIWASIPGEGSS